MNPEDVAGLIAGSSILVILALSVIGILIPIVAYWKILDKAGHPGPLALLFLLPFVGIIMLYWLALTDWPSLRKPSAQAPVGFPPPPAYPPAPPPPPVVMPAAPAAALPAFKFCAGCGTALEGAERFCRNCGRPVGT
jgi:hypothetical protein